jgi:hypothetical protein
MVDDAAQSTLPPEHAPRGRHVLYPNAYVWFVFLAAMDVICTYMIMHPALFYQPMPAGAVIADPDSAILASEPRGQELNPMAAGIIERYGMPGKVAYKFSLVVLVIVICEIVGRAKFASGKRLAEWAVALTAIPVVVAIVQMAVDTFK